jgi:hypothetical protein
VMFGVGGRVAPPRASFAPPTRGFKNGALLRLRNPR